MLLEFRAKNYKSFKDELVFSLIPAPKQKGLDYSVLKEPVGKKVYKALCSAVIYGPNASGKTNIIGAMHTFKSIVLRGHIRNSDEKGGPNVAAYALEIIPNIANATAEPVSFRIKFITDGMLVEYSITLDLGKFLDVDHKRKVLSEELKINNSLIFLREDGLELVFESLDTIQDLLVNAFAENRDGAMSLAKSNLNEEELFLMNGFKTMFSSKLVSLISSWLKNKFTVIYRNDIVNIIPKIRDIKKDSIYVDETLNEAVKHFGSLSNTLGYVVDGDNEDDAKLVSCFDKPEIDVPAHAISAEVFESYGTIRFVNMFPFVIKALIDGGTLIIDEFDASIHPMALMNIINIFHNDEINIHNAQLIFNTHNPIFLNANLFRRDEIKFVERDVKTHFSSHYSLSDFRTTGKSGVRKNEDYMKNYFVDRYGAIRNVDFTPIFKEFLTREKEVAGDA